MDAIDNVFFNQNSEVHSKYKELRQKHGTKDFDSKVMQTFKNFMNAPQTLSDIVVDSWANQVGLEDDTIISQNKATILQGIHEGFNEHGIMDWTDVTQRLLGLDKNIKQIEGTLPKKAF